MAALFFLAVSALSARFHAQQESLGENWFRRATKDREAGHLERAISEFQAAEQYSRANFLYQLNLAQTLAAQGRTDEAYSYLLNLRERQPDDGTVNLDLARVLARKGEAGQATRYYHNALYAVWPNEPEKHRRAVRFELIEFLLAGNAKTQAQSELIAMAANLPEDAGMHKRVGDLFLQAQDPDHALPQFREALRLDRRDAAAWAAAGRAAFELGKYPEARRYLESTVAENPGESASSKLLETVTLVLEMDPYRRPISAKRRDGSVLEAFATAGQRLKACHPEGVTAASTASGTAPEPSLEARWKQMQPGVTALGLRRNPDLADKAMDLVFVIEQETSATCGAPTGKDLALLLISKLHEGTGK